MRNNQLSIIQVMKCSRINAPTNTNSTPEYVSR